MLMRTLLGPAIVMITCASVSAAQPTTAPVKTREVAGMTFVRIEPGEFWMGSPKEEAGREDVERRHRVRLTKAFYLQATEVSQKVYAQVTGERPSRFRGDDLPVESVSWEDANFFCHRLNQIEKKRFRLPTEAEWEYAARAGKDGPVSGTGKLDEMAWHADNSGKRRIDSAKLWDTDPDNYFKRLDENGCRPRAVGTGRANDWGIHDMQGNVSEWVADWYAPFGFAFFPVDDPHGPAESAVESRVMRGGNWGSDPRNCRLAKREWNTPDIKLISTGFRVVLEE